MKKSLLFFLLAVSLPAAGADLKTGLDAAKAGDYSTAMRELQPLALDGNPDAAYRLCGMYYLGQGVPKNDAEAARLCRIAAEKGNPDAMYNLALFYQKGEGVGQDLNEAYRWYAAAAARGHPDAKYNFNQMKLASTANNPNSRKAIDLVRNGQARTSAKTEAAAPPGNEVPLANAPATLPPPPAPPVPPQMDAAPAGEQDAVSTDIAKYCIIAAQRGNPDPKCAKTFAPLLPPEKNFTAVMKPPAKPILNEAAPTTQTAKAENPAVPASKPAIPAPAKPAAKDKGKELASVPAATLVVNAPLPATTAASGTSEKPTENLKWFIDQANTGNALAQNNLGVMYRRGTNGAPKDPAQALKWFERAAAQGSTNAMINLASIYKDGEGTPQNLELAYAWYNLAASRLPKTNESRKRAEENVLQISQYLSNQQIGNALQYVSQLEETIPVLNEPETIGEASTPKAKP